MAADVPASGDDFDPARLLCPTGCSRYEHCRVCGSHTRRISGKDDRVAGTVLWTVDPCGHSWTRPDGWRWDA